MWIRYIQAVSLVALSFASAVAGESAPHEHLSEATRTAVQKLVILPTPSPSIQAVTGSYEKSTPGFIGGADSGSQIGKGVTQEIGPVAVNIPFRILTLPGALIGGVSGKTKQEIQKFRDALTEDLAQAASQPLTNDAVATDIFWRLRSVPNLEPRVFALTTPIPANTDAILYVSIVDMTIDVQGKDAIITTVASATLRRASDGKDLYRKDVRYQDRDTLTNWTADNNAVWRDYANFSRHYLVREISAQTFERLDVQHEFRPMETSTVKLQKKNDWRGVTRSATPTLAWDFTLLENESYGSLTDDIHRSDVLFDVEIYDMHQLVYAANRVADSSHTVAIDLEGCKTYRWSVRPSYRIGDDVRYGEWMRSGTGQDNGNIGRQASQAPAYLQDFASFEVKCGRR